MTTPITSTTPGATTNSTDATTGSQPMDKEAFLKLLVAQISHQDPLSPMEGTEFVTQLSQFAIVEQSIAQSSKLDTLSTQIGGVANNEATSLVGKRVTIRGHDLAFDGVTATSAAVTLDDPAQKVSADILDANGKVVRTIDIGSRPEGACTITWDGKDNAGNALPKGTYSVKVRATAADGTTVNTTQTVTGTVTKISFEKGYPELTLDNGSTGPISDLSAVEGQPAKP